MVKLPVCKHHRRKKSAVRVVLRVRVLLESAGVHRGGGEVSVRLARVVGPPTVLTSRSRLVLLT